MIRNTYIEILMRMAISAKLHILMKARQTQRETVLENFIGSRKRIIKILFHKFSL